MELIGIYMFAKALREITTKPEYNVKMISSDNPFSYLKKIEILYWEVFHLGEQKTLSSCPEVRNTTRMTLAIQCKDVCAAQKQGSG